MVHEIQPGDGWTDGQSPKNQLSIILNFPQSTKNENRLKFYIMN